MRGFWICLLVAGIMESCTPVRKYQYAEGKIYGTFYHVSYVASRDLKQEIHEQMELVNASLSMFNPESVISGLNRNETDTTDALFQRMYGMAEQVYQNTEGAFDITVGVLVNAWGFGFKQNIFPDSAYIDTLRQWVGMEKLALVNGRLKKKFPEITMDASSIAKGLGVDLVAEYLESQEVSDYMVEIGGEVRVKGKSSKDRPWRIGIDRPEDNMAAENRALQMIAELTSGALATSGNYRNFYVHKGKKYAHTIHPKTGYPVQTEVVSASVYAPACMEADAYATAFMVLGLEKSKQIILTNRTLEGVIIYLEEGKMQTWVSPGFKDMIMDK